MLPIPASILEPATQEGEKLDGMRRGKTIRIASNNEGGRFQSGNLLGPIIVLTHSFFHGGNQARKIFWLWRDTHIGLMDGSPNKDLRGNGCHAGLHFGMPASPFEGSGDHHEFVDPFRVANSGLQSHS